MKLERLLTITAHFGPLNMLHSRLASRTSDILFHVMRHDFRTHNMSYYRGLKVLANLIFEDSLQHIFYSQHTLLDQSNRSRLQIRNLSFSLPA